jgi:hypothetical protein
MNAEQTRGTLGDERRRDQVDVWPVLDGRRNMPDWMQEPTAPPDHEGVVVLSSRDCNPALPRAHDRDAPLMTRERPS